MKDVVMYEEAKEDTNGCPYCNRQFTNAEQAANQVNMFLTTECYHKFHIPCFKEYAKKRLVTTKQNRKSDTEIVFEDLQCLKCFKVVELGEAKEMFTREEYGKIEDDQM